MECVNLKILIIGTVSSSLLGFRGALIKSFLNKGHTVYTLSTDLDSFSKEKLEHLGVIPLSYSLQRSGMNPIFEVKSVYELYKKIKILKPDLVFSYFTKPVIYGSIASRLAKVPSINGMIEGLGYSFTEMEDGFSFHRKVLKLIQSILLYIGCRCSDKIIVLNDTDKKELEGITKRKDIFVLGGIGVDLEFYKHHSVSNEKVDFIFVSRLLKEKGIEEFLHASRKVKLKYSNVSFTVVGEYDNSSKNKLSNSSEIILHDESIINYVGKTNDVYSYLRNSSVFVLPSYYREGVPRSTQEALSVGRAVITTDHVGCNDTVIDGYNGYLVPRWDIESLYVKMCSFIEDTSTISIMGNNSRIVAEKRFNDKIQNERLVDFLFYDKAPL